MGGADVAPSWRRGPAVVETARLEAREALGALTERERAMFALSLLTEVRTPALCGLMGFISNEIKDHGVRLFRAAIQKR